MATLPEANKELKARAEERVERKTLNRSPFDAYGEAMETNAQAQLDSSRQILGLGARAARFAGEGASKFNDAVTTQPPASPNASEMGPPAPTRTAAAGLNRVLDDYSRVQAGGERLPEGIVRSEAGRYGVPIYAGRGQDGVRIFSDSAAGVAAMAPRAGGLRRDNPIAGDKRFEAQNIGNVKVPGFVDREIITGQRPTLTAEDLAVFDSLNPEDRKQVEAAAKGLDAAFGEQDSVEAFRARDAQRTRENASPIAGLRRDEFEALPPRERAELMQGAQTAQAQAASAQARAQEAQQRTQIMKQRLEIDIGRANSEAEKQQLAQINQIIDLQREDPEAARELLFRSIPPEVLSGDPKATEAFLKTQAGKYLEDLYQQELASAKGWFDTAGPATVQESGLPFSDFRVGYGDDAEYVDKDEIPFAASLIEDPYRRGLADTLQRRAVSARGLRKE